MGGAGLQSFVGMVCFGGGMISCGGVRKHMMTAMHCGLPGRRARATYNYCKRPNLRNCRMFM
jgi:hypothetical protein